MNPALSGITKAGLLPTKVGIAITLIWVFDLSSIYFSIAAKTQRALPE